MIEDRSLQVSFLLLAQGSQGNLRGFNAVNGYIAESRIRETPVARWLLGESVHASRRAFCVMPINLRSEHRQQASRHCPTGGVFRGQILLWTGRTL